jgi:hypothetical protein
MKKQTTPMLIIIIMILSIFSCSSPKFAGFQTKIDTSKLVETKTIDLPNLEFQAKILNSLKLDNLILKSLDINSVIMVTNYNLYPFNQVKAATDSTAAVYSTVVDKNINTEFSLKIEKELLSKGYNILENEEIYNRLYDNNFDEFGLTLNFEILNFGILFEHISDKKVIRHGKCNIRYRVITKTGQLKLIQENDYSIKDTISSESLAMVSQPQLALGYSNFYYDQNLTDISLPNKGGKAVPSIYTVAPKDKVTYSETLKGMRFRMPNETKEYSLVILDNKVYKELLSRKNGRISPTDLISLSPLKRVIKSNNKSTMKKSDGTVESIFFCDISVDELGTYFEKSNEIVVLYKAVKICTLRKFGDGSINAI